MFRGSKSRRESLDDEEVFEELRVRAAMGDKPGKLLPLLTAAFVAESAPPGVLISPLLLLLPQLKDSDVERQCVRLVHAIVARSVAMGSPPGQEVSAILHQLPSEYANPSFARQALAVRTGSLLARAPEDHTVILKAIRPLFNKVETSVVNSIESLAVVDSSAKSRSGFGSGKGKGKAAREATKQAHLLLACELIGALRRALPLSQESATLVTPAICSSTPDLARQGLSFFVDLAAINPRAASYCVAPRCPPRSESVCLDDEHCARLFYKLCFRIVADGEEAAGSRTAYDNLLGALALGVRDPRDFVCLAAIYEVSKLPWALVRQIKIPAASHAASITGSPPPTSKRAPQEESPLVPELMYRLVALLAPHQPLSVLSIATKAAANLGREHATYFGRQGMQAEDTGVLHPLSAKLVRLANIPSLVLRGSALRAIVWTAKNPSGDNDSDWFLLDKLRSIDLPTEHCSLVLEALLERVALTQDMAPVVLELAMYYFERSPLAGKEAGTGDHIVRVWRACIGLNRELDALVLQHILSALDYSRTVRRSEWWTVMCSFLLGEHARKWESTPTPEGDNNASGAGAGAGAGAGVDEQSGAGSSKRHSKKKKGKQHGPRGGDPPPASAPVDRSTVAPRIGDRAAPERAILARLTSGLYLGSFAERRASLDALRQIASNCHGDFQRLAADAVAKCSMHSIGRYLLQGAALA